MAEASIDRSDRIRGWVYVLIQVGLFAALILLPRDDGWTVPGWLNLVGNIITLFGLAMAVSAGLRLGRNLTPTPVPTDNGELVTSGLYELVRHPIYTGVLFAVAGITIRSGSFIILLVAIFTFVFFWQKADWEEQQLAKRYRNYKKYAAKTPRFFPKGR